MAKMFQRKIKLHPPSLTHVTHACRMRKKLGGMMLLCPSVSLSLSLSLLSPFSNLISIKFCFVPPATFFYARFEMRHRLHAHTSKALKKPYAFTNRHFIHPILISNYSVLSQFACYKYFKKYILYYSGLKNVLRIGQFFNSRKINLC